jgi:hypothetical protein
VIIVITFCIIQKAKQIMSYCIWTSRNVTPVHSKNCYSCTHVHHPKPYLIYNYTSNLEFRYSFHVLLLQAYFLSEFYSYLKLVDRRPYQAKHLLNNSLVCLLHASQFRHFHFVQQQNKVNSRLMPQTQKGLHYQ